MESAFCVNCNIVDVVEKTVVDIVRFIVQKKDIALQEKTDLTFMLLSNCANFSFQ